MQLEPCAHCKRHVAIDAVACPFCDAPISPAPARPHVIGRWSRAAIFAGATTLAGCHTSTPPTTPHETNANATSNGTTPDGATANDTIKTDASASDTIQNDATANTTTAAPDPMTIEPEPEPEAVKAGKVAKPKPGTGTIYGVLLDERGRAVPNAVITIDGANRATTDRHGKYVFPDLRPGNYTVELQEPSSPHANRNERRVVVKAGGIVEANGTLYPEPVDRGPCCKPYGAPPARRRVV